MYMELGGEAGHAEKKIIDESFSKPHNIPLLGMEPSSHFMIRNISRLKTAAVAAIVMPDA